MTLSVSAATTFANITWDNLEDRPIINDSMPLCSSYNWEYDIPCCTDGYVISDALQMAYEEGKENTAEALFLNKYPCVNSLEFEKLADDIIPPASQDWKSEENKPSLLLTISQSIIHVVEKVLMKCIK